MLVSVGTPTYQRPMQLARCMLSVAKQTYRPLEHVIVSDADPQFPHAEFELFCYQLKQQYDYEITFVMLDDHEVPSWWGNKAKREIIVCSSGELQGWCDDDDVLRPRHVELLANGLKEAPEAGFAFSKIWICPDAHVLKSVNPQNELKVHGGVNYPDVASIHTPNVLMYRRELDDISTWRPEPGPEWELVKRWLAAGVKWTCVDAVTADAYTAERFYAELYPMNRGE